MRSIFVATAILGAVGCGGRNAVQCEQSANCDLSGGGMCLAASTGNMWCAYPDPECPGGYRWSTTGTGDGLSGECVPDNSGSDGGVTDTYTLTIQVAGSGMGLVSSMPTGLSCESGGTGTCTKVFDAGTQVTLDASPTSGAFLGWTEDCTGMSGCSVTMTRDRTVTAMFGTPGEALWSQQIGGTMQDRAQALELDGDGNLIVAGNFSGSFTVGTGTYTSAGSQDFFVAKLNPSDGSISWVKTFGGTAADGASGVSVDSANNIYVAGVFRDSVDFGGGAVSAAGAFDGYVLKLDGDGEYQWMKQLKGGSASADAISVRGATVAVGGTYQTTLTANGTTVTNGGTFQGYLVTMGTDGSPGLVKPITGSSYSSVDSVVIDNSDNIVIGGSFSGNADFGNGSVTANLGDVYFAKYTASGTYLIAKSFGGSSNDSGGSVSVDPADNIFFSGTFTGSVSFGGPSPVNANTANLVVAKFSSAGAYQWAEAFGGTTAQISGNIAANSAGDVVVAGSFCGSVQFGTSFVASVGTCAQNDHDIYAARLAGTDGAPVTAMRAGGSSADLAYAVVHASDGRHFVVGAFQGFADFGGTSRTSLGADDAIILALAPL